MATSNKVIVRLKGGLGNQMFCYAAGRRLALRNDAELVLDDVTGFVRDTQYRRTYSLGPFRVAGRKATPTERLEPWERYRRGLAKWLARRKTFDKRRYIEQVGLDYEPLLLGREVRGTVYLDGYWQSELYFKDIASTIRADFELSGSVGTDNQRIAAAMAKSASIALHVRWFDLPGSGSYAHNASLEYYGAALRFMEERVTNGHYYLFSDDPVAAQQKLQLPAGRVTIVDRNFGDANAHADLWLMTQCRHCITANSTFSWWGAWLGRNSDRIVTTPALKLAGAAITAWNLPNQIPETWHRL